jgi:hypothetical protein
MNNSQDIQTTQIYLINEDKQFVMAGSVPTDELTSECITKQPPFVEGMFKGTEGAYWNGSDWEIKLTEEGTINLWSEIRTKRNQLLSECDWTQVADADITKEFKSKMKAYRQELRDLSDKYDDPRELVWPELPTE